jgi:hypothetical protein
MFFKLSKKAQAGLDEVIDRFQHGDIGPVVDVLQLRLQLPADAPARQWTFTNQVLAYAQSGCLDCRGYVQWQSVGRQVQKGTHGAFILGPCLKTVEDEETGEKKQVLTGFTGISVHPLTHTEGDPIPEYEPAELPPLLDVAARMGVSVTWQPLPPDRNGEYAPDRDAINVGTHDTKTFFHELAHAAHKRVKGTLKGGQDVTQETVAELVATVLMHLYGLGDRTGGCWQYVRLYSDEPLQAMLHALHDVEQVLAVLLSGSDEGPDAGDAGAGECA